MATPSLFENPPSPQCTAKILRAWSRTLTCQKLTKQMWGTIKSAFGKFNPATDVFFVESDFGVLGDGRHLKASAKTHFQGLFVVKYHTRCPTLFVIKKRTLRWASRIAERSSSNEGFGISIRPFSFVNTLGRNLLFILGDKAFSLSKVAIFLWCALLPVLNTFDG